MAYDEDLADRIRELLSERARGDREEDVRRPRVPHRGQHGHRRERSGRRTRSGRPRPGRSPRRDHAGRGGSDAWPPDAGLAPRRVRRPAHQASAREVGEAGLGATPRHCRRRRSSRGPTLSARPEPERVCAKSAFGEHENLGRNHLEYQRLAALALECADSPRRSANHRGTSISHRAGEPAEEGFVGYALRAVPSITTSSPDFQVLFPSSVAQFAFRSG